MKSANNTQVGGTHYKRGYQHWDLVPDTDMPYHLACATKYVSRWREKNGLEDLKKSIHYIQKSKERGIFMPHHNVDFVAKFCKQLEPSDAVIISLIVGNQFIHAIDEINQRISEVELGHTYIKG